MTLDELKTELELEYIDNAGMQRLSRILDTGKVEIQNKAGAEIDYTADLVAKDMLITYCMYAWARKVADFWQHYNAEVLSMRESHGNPV